MEHTKKGTLLKVGLGVAVAGAVLFLATRSNAATNPPAPAPTPPGPLPPAPAPGPLNGGGEITPTPGDIAAAQAAGQAGGAANAVNAATANPFPGATAQGQGQAPSAAAQAAADLADALNQVAGTSAARPYLSPARMRVGAVSRPLSLAALRARLAVLPLRRCQHPHGCGLRPAPQRGVTAPLRLPAGTAVRVLGTLPGGKTDRSSPGNGGWLRVVAQGRNGQPVTGYVLQEWFV